jgi:hypothetical protein
MVTACERLVVAMKGGFVYTVRRVFTNEKQTRHYLLPMFRLNALLTIFRMNRVSFLSDTLYSHSDYVRELDNHVVHFAHHSTSLVVQRYHKFHRDRRPNP